METSDRRGKERRRRLRRSILMVLVLILSLMLWSCFPGPMRDLWPPRPGEPRYRIDVVYHDWHTMVILSPEALARARGNAAADRRRRALQQWEFCEKTWYLEGHQGVLGVLRALFWPTASGVAARVWREPPWRHWPEEETERWTFVVSEPGLVAMLRYLRAEKGPALEGHPGWYEGESSYHLFYNCHHFTAGALRSAGLPVRPWWAFSAWLIEIQLDRTARYHIEERLAAE